MSDDTGASGDASEPPVDGDSDDVTPVPGLSDDGILLFFAATACLLSAAVAYSTGLPDAVAAFAIAGGVPAAVAFVVDVRTEYVPGSGVELVVGGAAVGGALLAIPGRHYATIATLLAAAALVFWRVFDVEVRGEER